MLLEIKRFEYGQTYTISRVYLDGVDTHLFTLEDKVREVQGQPVSTWKVFGETAIPKGTYKIIINFSAHFQQDLPLLLNVPGFEGVRIHCGNTSKDTEGCLLLGASWNGGDFVGNSKAAFSKLFPTLEAAKDPILLKIGDSVQDFHQG
jgi:hypothetical protein